MARAFRYAGALSLVLAGGVPTLVGQEAAVAVASDSAVASVPPPLASVLAGISEPQLRDALTESVAKGPRLTSSDVDDVVTRWQETTGGPSDGSGWLLAARLWRQAGQPDSAVTMLRRADDVGGLPGGLLSLEAARGLHVRAASPLRHRLLRRVAEQE